MKSEDEVKKRTEYWKKSLAGIIDNSAEFDRETCPFCNCTLDLQKDLDSGLSLSSGICLFKCHACGTVYVVMPVVTSWQALVLKKCNPLYSKQNA
jgi:hypothetical protein